MPERAPLHAGLAAGRWHKMTLDEQLGNIGSEVSRALRARAQDNESRLRAALERALELFDLTVADPRFVTERAGVVRAREVVCDFLVGDNDYQTTPGSLEADFLAFATAARNNR